MTPKILRDKKKYKKYTEIFNLTLQDPTFLN